jgi:hypothetical protein
VNVRLTIHASPTASAGLFSGTIQVRARTQRGQGRVFARPLPITVAIQAAESIPGIDANSNGVWDDIDHYIDSNYGSASPNQRAALRQFSRALEGALLNAASKNSSLLYAVASDRATECIYSLRPDDAGRVIQDLKAAILNNRVRSRAFLMWSEQSAGEVFRSKPKSQRASSCITE